MNCEKEEFEIESNEKEKKRKKSMRKAHFEIGRKHTIHSDFYESVFNLYIFLVLRSHVHIKSILPFHSPIS